MLRHPSCNHGLHQRWWSEVGVVHSSKQYTYFLLNEGPGLALGGIKMSSF